MKKLVVIFLVMLLLCPMVVKADDNTLIPNAKSGVLMEESTGKIIFEKNKEIRLKWQKRLEYIMIDEFQDIDKIQYQLMKVLCGYHKNLFIVRDPDQTI